jgi:Sec-independent protein translocase protein TatA
MFSIADMAVAGAVALLLFGPDQLPKVARRAGQLVRDVQNTSQSFIREMERAADAVPDAHDPAPPAAAIAALPTYHEAPQPAAHAFVEREAAPDPHAGPAGAGGQHAGTGAADEQHDGPWNARTPLN